jgi:hypothetical protein
VYITDLIHHLAGSLSATIRGTKNKKKKQPVEKAYLPTFTIRVQLMVLPIREQQRENVRQQRKQRSTGLLPSLWNVLYRGTEGVLLFLLGGSAGGGAAGAAAPVLGHEGLV